MGNGEFKKFIIYSLFLAVLILPMVGFPGTHFEAKRAFIVSLSASRQGAQSSMASRDEIEALGRTER